MKRGPGRARPNDIVEVPAARPDPRSADPQATQKISRAQLDEALKRTKSGTRRALRSEPALGDGDGDGDSFAGPRDDTSTSTGPEITIVRIDSIEIDAVAPLSLPSIRATPMSSMMSPMVIRTPGAPLVDASGAAANARALSSRSSSSSPSSSSRAVSRRAWPTRRLQVTPRTAFVAAVAVALFVLLAGFIGFFAGRIAPGSK